MLQGDRSPFMLTMPTIGLAIAASSSPVARMKARCGARSSPSVVMRERRLGIFKISKGFFEVQHRRRVNLPPGRSEAADGAEGRPNEAMHSIAEVKAGLGAPRTKDLGLWSPTPGPPRLAQLR